MSRPVIVGWVLLSTALLGVIALYLALTPAGPLVAPDPARSLESSLWPVPEFELINTEGEVVTNRDLKGLTWVAAFIFTRCPGPCPLISKRMSQLQEQIRTADGIRLVSFSVDPDFDRPEVLRAYARQWNADPDIWWFLTQDDPGEMARVVREFKIALDRTPELKDEPASISHGTSLLLIDGQQKVRAVFRSSDPDVVQQVLGAIRQLASEAGLPSAK